MKNILSLMKKRNLIGLTSLIMKNLNKSFNFLKSFWTRYNLMMKKF